MQQFNDLNELCTDDQEEDFQASSKAEDGNEANERKISATSVFELGKHLSDEQEVCFDHEVSTLKGSKKIAFHILNVNMCKVEFSCCK